MYGPNWSVSPKRNWKRWIVMNVNKAKPVIARFRWPDQFGPYMVRPPPYLINFYGIFNLDLFWSYDTTVEPVGVRDIYALEFKIFSNPLWVAFYLVCVGIFMTHACLGWKKVTPVLGDPKGHQDRVVKLGYIIFIV